jgi:hypothetical protein
MAQVSVTKKRDQKTAKNDEAQMVLGHFGERSTLYTPMIWRAFLDSHKVLIFIEHHSVCPLIGIRTPPTPLSQASVPSPLDQRVGGTLARG